MVMRQLLSTGIVEIEREGRIHRGQYRTDGTAVTVSYQDRVRKTEMRGSADMPHAVARALLREIVAELHAHV